MPKKVFFRTNKKITKRKKFTAWSESFISTYIHVQLGTIRQSQRWFYMMHSGWRAYGTFHS